MSDANSNQDEAEDRDNRLMVVSDAVCDKDTFLNFVDALARDADDAEGKMKSEFSPNGWEHGSIGSFLDAVVRCSDGKRGRFSEEASWKTFADMLYSGKIYE